MIDFDFIEIGTSDFDTEIQKDAEYRRLMRERNAAYQKVRELRDLERLFLKRKHEAQSR